MAKKPTVTTLASGFNSTETLNANFEALRDGFDNTLSLDGSTPNAMGGDLDLNSNKIINATAIMVGGEDVVVTTAAALAAAVQAQIDADAAVVASALSETNAANSATASQTSADASQASRLAAELAETNAETAETNAETAETNSQTSATNSAASANAALGSETAASSSAAAALASQVAANTSQGNASVSALAASNSETAAALSETNAATSETNAATSETNAASSATASANSATASAASETAAATSETNAATSETNAAASAVTATTGATTATAQAVIATTKAGEASTSATNAATSATSAQASKDAALAALDSFDDRYLGQKTADPTVDNDGDALVSGALYFNTTDDIMKVYDGSLWVAAYASLSGAMFGANNLSDVADAAGSRSNLGLGTAATTASTAYATAAQGTLADSATQPSDLATVATSGVYSDLTGKPTLGTAAATASTDYATAAQGALADSAVQPNDSPTFAGLTTTADVSFGDNDKAIFGAGSDLQIFHTGAYSAIRDVGTGGLFIGGENYVDIGNANASESYARFHKDAQVDLYHNNAVKFATTSTGVDVTGTITSDGLTVSGSGTSSLVNISNGVDSSPNRQLAISETGGSGFIYQIDSTGASGLFGQLAFATNGSEAMRIDSSGNVGIGTTTVGQIFTTDVGLTVDSGNAYSGIHFTDGATSGALAQGYSTTYLYNRANGSMLFGTNDSERMRIDAAGNLLVGTTDTSLYNNGAGGNTGVLLRGDVGNIQAARSTGAPLGLNRLDTDGDIAVFAKNGATVGSIGANGSNIYIAGSATYPTGIRFYNAGMNPCNHTGAYVDNARDIGASNVRWKDLYLSGTANAANFNTTSDATLKTNVETLTGSLDKVKALRGVSYDWIESGGSEIGVIAQEVEAVIPDVVSTNDEGIKSVKYGNMVAVLIEAIKEQQLRIEALESKLGE